jgi:hypothetical protein
LDSSPDRTGDFVIVVWTHDGDWRVMPFDDVPADLEGIAECFCDDQTRRLAALVHNDPRVCEFLGVARVLVPFVLDGDCTGVWTGEISPECDVRLFDGASFAALPAYSADLRENLSRLWQGMVPAPVEVIAALNAHGGAA